jgi:hypothetical protein
MVSKIFEIFKIASNFLKIYLKCLAFLKKSLVFSKKGLDAITAMARVEIT